jgi:hypothetical protein
MSIRLGIPSNLLRVAEVELLPLSLLAFCYGLYFFFLNLLLHAADGISEPEEWSIFVGSWLAIPGLAIASSQVVSRSTPVLRRRLFCPVLLAANGLVLFVSECGLYVFHPGSISIRKRSSPRHSASRSTHRDGERSSCIDRVLAAHRPMVVKVVYGSLPLMALLAAIPFARGLGTHLDALVVVVLIAFLFCVLRQVTARMFTARFARILDILVVFIITLSVLDFSFSFDQAHHNFYLGPVTDLMLGNP